LNHSDEVFSTRHFHYQLPVFSAIQMVLVPIVLTAGMTHIASARPDSRLMRRLSRLLFPEALSALLWGFVAFGVIASILVICLAIRSQTGVHYVELGPSGILVPKASMSMKQIRIPYLAITHLQIGNYHGQRIVVIHSKVGESRLSEKSFATPKAFESFLQVLEERFNGKLS
jgi:hypothetical protein